MDCDGLFYSVSPSPVKLRFIFVVLWLFSSPASGQPQVIGSLQPIRAAPGDDIILPCHVEPPINVSGLTVEWSRPDLKPDPNDRQSKVDYVHLYRDRREVTDIKISTYVGRTLLSTEGLGKGNISLNIYNVTLEDEGRFKCFIPKLEGQKKSAIVILVVELNSPTTETPLQSRYLQTPDPKEETADKGVSSRSKVIPVVVFSCFFGILFIGFSVYFGIKTFRKAVVQNMI